MPSWIINENHLHEGYRELELYYSGVRKIVKLWEDGRIEIGSRNSLFTPDWQEKVNGENNDYL